jgi:short subunit dehydrogenase-like uncharacterized protein
LRALPVLAALSPTRALLRRLAPRPGSGPSLEKRARGRFEVHIFGMSDGEPEVGCRCIVRAELDPGYAATARMLAQSALCLALDDLPARGGVLTPASAMGRTLIARLGAANITIEVESDRAS